MNKDCILLGPECGTLLALTDESVPNKVSPNPCSVLGVGSTQLDLISGLDGESRHVYMGANI